ncbi:MAG TPA: S9 family peptidase [Vicinamibacterales bacterium]|jgi:dipeptidyl aminopeptidase/acylaminoacyl peptidase
MRSTLVAAACAAAVSCPVPAFAARPMTINDLLAAVRVSEPQLSPDGRTVAYVRTTTDLATGRRNADIWVVAADGSSPPRLLVGGEKTETSPRWSPDGKTLAFLSNRDGAELQVYVAGADGGGIRQVTKIAAGAQPPLLFSPDSSRLAFVSDVRMFDEPANVHVLTRLLFRHWDEWRENVRHHIFVAPVDGGDATDLTPGDYDSPPTQQEDAAITFTPDGRELVFVSNREGSDREAFTTNNDVWSVPVAGGEAKKLTPNAASDLQPRFTPDGRLLIVRAQRRPQFESDRFYLDVYDRTTGRKRTLFETPDLSVTDFAVSRDGQTVFFIASNRATDNLYSVPVAGGTPTEVAHGGGIGSPQPGDGFVVFSRSTLNSPAEIMRGGARGAAVPLTHENDGWLKDVAFAKPESLTVPGAGGTPVQYWLIKPPDFDPAKKYPVVFLIHGGPQGDWGDAWSSRWNPSLWAAQGWVIAAPNPRGSTGFGQKFVDEITQDWAGKVMLDLDAVFDAVAKLPYVDPARQGIAGASYGGYAVDWLITHTDRFKAAVSHDGVFNLDSMALATEEGWFTQWEFGGLPWTGTAKEQFQKFSPHRYAGNLKTPTLVITNQQDFRVPVDQGLQLFTALRLHGVPSKALVFEDEGHWVLKALNSRFWHEQVFAWLNQYLK